MFPWVLSLILRILPNFSLEPYTNISEDLLALSNAWGDLQHYTCLTYVVRTSPRFLFISSTCVMVSTARYVLTHFGLMVFSGWNLITSLITEFRMLNTNSVTHRLQTFILPGYQPHLFESFWLSPVFSTSAALSLTYCYHLCSLLHIFMH